ncbi:hypothetical protein O6H91_03G103800 [Diphasiastrum complanatum]|uniref:Uncharacterized protein n=1 Tax=Diphasiastrum complanatum TaxID=34168 RepID=A0ACC2E9Y1_DIPCM|nr:hypothetical protein O6H91_03G103800 [Diphasiastrum complanatum]
MEHASDSEGYLESVIQFLRIPTAAEYTFDSNWYQDYQPTSEENLLADFNSIFFKPFATKSVSLDTKVHCRQIMRLSDIEMVESLRSKRLMKNHVIIHPAIKDADVYSLHPADLMSASGTRYFFCLTKYSSLKRPTRLRITNGGCRWKQQGRVFPVKQNGEIVAYKTYLSYVSLKRGQAITHDQDDQVTDCSQIRKNKKWSTFTMEEIALVDDVKMERYTLRRGNRPIPFPVICRIASKCSPGFDSQIGCDNIVNFGDCNRTILVGPAPAYTNDRKLDRTFSYQQVLPTCARPCGLSCDLSEDEEIDEALQAFISNIPNLEGSLLF